MNQQYANEAFIKIKVSEFFAFIKQVVDGLKAESKMPPCKIVDWNETDNEVFLMVHISGTLSTVAHRPQDILENHKFLRQFDQLDVVAMKNFELYEALKPKYKISAIDFTDQTKVKITKVGGEEKEYCINEFKKDYSLLSELSQSDAFLIGRMVGQAELDI